MSATSLVTVISCAFGLLIFSGNTYADTREVVVYPGFGGSTFVIEGRVIEARGGAPEAEGDSWFTNIKRTLRRLISDEQDEVPVQVKLDGRAWRAVTDEEGYFRVEGDLPAGAPAGWRQIEAATESGDARATGAMLVVPRDNRLGIISDIDDTILISEVTDKSRLLRNVLLVNYAQRKAVPGTADFYARLTRRNPNPEAAPVFYLSASPRQLHAGIQAFLDRNGFPRGVLITKKVTNDKTSDPWIDQVKYKIGRIEQVLTALPQCASCSWATTESATRRSTTRLTGVTRIASNPFGFERRLALRPTRPIPGSAIWPRRWAHKDRKSGRPKPLP